MGFAYAIRQSLINWQLLRGYVGSWDNIASCCREVTVRVIVWTVCRDQNKSGHCRDQAAVSGD